MLTYQNSVPQSNTSQIEVKNSEGRSAKFDAVVFTIPAPQLLEIDMDGKMAPEVSKTMEFDKRTKTSFQNVPIKGLILDGTRENFVHYLDKTVLSYQFSLDITRARVRHDLFTPCLILTYQMFFLNCKM